MSFELRYTTLFAELSSGVLHLVMNQPPSNRMSLAFFTELALLVDQIKGSPEVKAVVVSGQGRHFSSGADLDELVGHLAPPFGARATTPESLEIMERNIEAFRYFGEANIPVIAAIRGVCIGSAFELALFCHFRFCGEDAVFGLPESTYNLIPGIGGVSRLVHLAGTATAMELAMKGSTFDARTALGYGLVDRILPKREVVAAALEFAATLPSNYHREKSSLYLQRTFAHG